MKTFEEIMHYYNIKDIGNQQGGWLFLFFFG
jgi:hypothetical protein